MFGRGRGACGRQDMGCGTDSDTLSAMGAAGQFAGAMLKELVHAGQPPNQQPRCNSTRPKRPTSMEHNKSHQVCRPKVYPGEQKASTGHNRQRDSTCKKGPRSPQHSLVVPYVHKTGLLKPKDIIFICGIPKPKAERFSVYLQNGSRFEPSSVACCVDTRFAFGGDRNCIVRNHKDGGHGWGMEEKQIEHFPFKIGEHFEMIILVEKDCFKVAVNDKHLFRFNHRIQQLNRIDTLRIDGDVTLTQVRIQT